ncbi:MAG: sigma factor-like helix-turn-helix DNA-binding protein [Candidatus Paceibacterota bacterium]|jgi:DNA-directed RNA polymerase delta subunit
MSVITFRPKQVTKSLLTTIPPRARDVIIGRFGLDETPERKTLEAIGNTYGITRERVRQIENFAIASLKKSDAFEKSASVFDELKKILESLGGIMSEEDFLEYLTNDKITQNHITLYLVLSDDFTKHKEDNNFKHRWSVDDAIAEEVHSALHDLHGSVSDNDLIPEKEIIERFLDRVKVEGRRKTDDTAKRWLGISKVLDKNTLGDWGVASSPNISARGIRDYSFLVIRRHGSPMHFTEVAKKISETFGKKAHVATCHNELIKDDRFVLVGRGLYVLSEWGYTGGVVKDVIRHVLEKSGPLTKQEIVDKVMKERYVKENTILVNLQNAKYFKKDKDGKYHIV